MARSKVKSKFAHRQAELQKALDSLQQGSIKLENAAAEPVNLSRADSIVVVIEINFQKVCLLCFYQSEVITTCTNSSPLVSPISQSNIPSSTAYVIKVVLPCLV